MGGEGVPVGDEKKAVEFLLQPDPVFQDPVVVPEVQAPRRSHA